MTTWKQLRKAVTMVEVTFEEHRIWDIYSTEPYRHCCAIEKTREGESLVRD